MTRAEEVAEKEKRVRQLLEKQNLDGIVLTKRGNFAWLTAGGDNHVGNATEAGIASLLITKEKKFLITDNIEFPRLQAEEIEGLGFEPVVFPWYEGGREAAISNRAAGMKLASDLPFDGAAMMEDEIARLRWSLLEPEVERYRWLGRACAEAVSKTCRQMRPGRSEFAAAGAISAALQESGISPFVLLVAADERIKHFRHPIPTDNKIRHCCMVVICGQRWGLILSMTRLVHFGPLPEDLKRRHLAVVAVDAAAIAATRPGSTAGQVFSAIKQAYAHSGFPEEWRLHHQGGATGYAGRDWKACREDDNTPLLENQAFAWNPSITGTKSEDTIIATSSDAEILCPTPDLPTIAVQTEVGPIERADILVV